MNLLDRSVTFKDDKFEQLGGILAFEALEKIVGQITLEMQSCHLTLRPVKQLLASHGTIVKTLEKFRACHDEIKNLVLVFQMIRMMLGDVEMTKQTKISRLAELYKTLWLKHKDAAHYRTLDDVKMLQPSPSLSFDSIICQWYRLWTTHQDGLFHYLDIEGMQRTNIFNEQMFSYLRRAVIKAHGIAHEAHSIYTRGSYYIKSSVRYNEIWIENILEDYDHENIRSLYEPLRERIQERVATYRNSPLIMDAVHIVADKIRNKSWERNKAESI